MSNGSRVGLTLERDIPYRLLAESAADVIWTCDKTGKFTYVSPSVQRLRGYTPEEVLEQTWEEALTPESCARAKALFLERFAKLNPDPSVLNRVELEQTCKDGSTIWTETITTPLRDKDGQITGVIGITRNIQEKKAFERALKESERRFRDLVDLAPQPVFELDEEGYISFISKKANDYFGFTDEQLSKGVHGLELIAPESRELAVERLKKALAGEDLDDLQYRALRKDGGTFPCLIPTCPIMVDGKPKGIRGIVVDITDLKKAEELHVNEERLKALTELSSGISHNFNNALQIIQGNAEIALRKAQKSGANDLLKNINQILRSSKLASLTIRRLQFFTKNEISRQEWEVLDLADLVQESVELSKVWWDRSYPYSDADINVSMDTAPDCLVKGNAHELLEVMLNLIKNSVESVPQEGGEINIKTMSDSEWGYLIIRDTGVGMSQETLKRIYDPFFSNKKLKNYGMGLSVSLGIIKGHLGEISVQSQENKGTEFQIKLPLANSKVHEIPEPPETEDTDFQVRILVVDDLEPVLEMISEGLLATGQQVYTASSGQEAIDIFIENDIDIIICDLIMPGMDGWTVHEKIREICDQTGKPRPPFVILSGSGEHISSWDQKVDEPISKAIKKPVDMNRLLAVIEDLVLSGKATSKH